MPNGRARRTKKVIACRGEAAASFQELTSLLIIVSLHVFDPNSVANLDHQRVAVEIVYDEAIWLTALFINEPRYSRAAIKAIVVVDDHPSGNQSRKNPIADVPGGFVNIYINMTKPKLPIAHPCSGMVGENAFQDLHAIKVQPTAQ